MKHLPLLTRCFRQALLLCLFGGSAFAATQELLTNGGFGPPYLTVSGTNAGGTVSGTFPSGWNDNSRNQGRQVNNIYSEETAGTVSGSAFKAITAAGTGANPAPAVLVNQTMNFIPGRTLSGSVWMKASAPTSVSMRFFLHSSPFTVRASRTCNVTTEWQQFTLGFTPTVSEVGRMELSCLQAVTLWMDEASVTVANGGATITVSPSGSDTTGDGLLAAPFRTIAKAMSHVYPGDTVQLRAGTYRETITPTQSGMADAPITIVNYNHEAVTVTGADAIAGPWTAGAGGVFAAEVGWDLTAGKNNVFVDGAMVHEARSPNYGSGDVLHPATASMTRDATNTNLITSTLFSGKPDNFFAGARWHAGINQKWNWSAGTIGNSTGNTVTLSASSAPVFTGAGAGYVYGLLSLLDADNEWFLQTNAGPPHTLSLRIAGQADPSSHLVEMRRRTYTLDCNGKNYIVVRGLNLRCGDVRMNGTGDVLDRCEASHLSHFLTYANGYQNSNGIVVSGTGNTVSNCTIHDTAGCGLLVTGTGHLLTRNTISNTDYSGTYSSAVSIGAGSTGHTVSFNTAHHSGRDVLYLASGTNSGHKIIYNDLSEPGQMCKDLGVIYTWGSNAQGATGGPTRIAYNWVHDNALGGASPLIYLDNWCRNYVVDHNVCWAATGDSGIRLNGPTDGHEIYHNTLFNCDDIGTHTYTVPFSDPNNPDPAFWTASGTYGVDLRNNLFLGTTPDSQLTSSATRDFRPKPGAAAIDSATLIAGYNDRFTGAAPDTGAYEAGGTYWVPGVAGYAAPTVATVAVTGVTVTTGTLHGTVNPNGAATTAEFVYGLDINYGSTATVTLSPNNGDLGQAVSAVLSGLQPDSTYHYRLTATNLAGTVITSDATFTTAPDTTPPTISGTFSPLMLTIGASGTVALPNYATQASTSDNVGVTSVTQSPASGTVLVAGTTHVTLTAHDAMGNMASTGFDVLVQTVSEAWRQTWFGSPANSGNAADDADPNRNGIRNLLEYALGGDPVGATTGVEILPQLGRSASDTLQMTFTRHLDRHDLTLTVRATDSLTGIWTDLARSTAGGEFVVLTPGATAPETGSGNTRSVTVTDLYPVTDPAHPARFLKLEVTR